MAQIKTSELSGSALDWAVAKCEGRKEPEVANNFAVAWYTWRNTHYSTNWAQGGPIIERERIDINSTINQGSVFDEWRAVKGIGQKNKITLRPNPTNRSNALLCGIEAGRYRRST